MRGMSVAIAAPHDQAVSAAEHVIRDGGNALDAALAAATVLAVTYPHQCSLGGDLTALVRLPDDGRVLAILSLGAAARTIDVEAVAAMGEMPDQGPLAVTVPGVVGGWVAVAKLGARFGLSAPLQHAAVVAASGATVSPGLARAIAARWTAIVSDAGLSSMFSAGGRPLPVAADFKQPALAATLRELADDPMSLYTGAVGARFAAALAELGSPLTAADLQVHAVEYAQPLKLTITETSWWAPPPPAQGATALALIDDRDPRDLLTRAREAHAARDRLLGDPHGELIDIDGMLHPSDVLASTGVEPHGSGDTVAVTAVDSTGRSVALLQSLFGWFGAGLLEPHTGIVLHNRGSAFAIDPSGRHPGRLRAGARPPHTLCPLLAEAGGMRAAIGCQGGRLQPLILAQVAAQATDAAADVQAAISAPRWVVGSSDLELESNTVLCEPGAEPPAAVDLPVVAADRLDDRCGHVQVARSIGTTLEAASDPRADGRGAVVEAD